LGTSKREKGNSFDNHDPSDVSFVLERKGTGLDSGNGPNGQGGKLGLFTIALVMCVCCINSFFAPSNVTVNSNGSMQGQVQTQGQGGASGING
jgi:hypothetical protein